MEKYKVERYDERTLIVFENVNLATTARVIRLEDDFTPHGERFELPALWCESLFVWESDGKKMVNIDGIDYEIIIDFRNDIGIR